MKNFPTGTGMAKQPKKGAPRAGDGSDAVVPNVTPKYQGDNPAKGETPTKGKE